MSGVNWTEEQLREFQQRVPVSGPPKSQFPRPKKPAPKPGQMNKTEAAFAQYLDMRKQLGQVAWWRFECLTVRIADDVRYTPDFAARMADGSVRLYDVKGRTRKANGKTGPWVEEDARIKIRVAADQWPCFEWYLTWSERHGEWAEQRIHGLAPGDGSKVGL